MIKKIHWSYSLDYLQYQKTHMIKKYRNKERKIVFRFIFQASVLQTDDDTNKRQVRHGYL